MAGDCVTVAVVLATFNDARFLPVEPAPIEAQTHRAWRLIVGDGGSAHGSPPIIEAFARLASWIEPMRLLRTSGW